MIVYIWGNLTSNNFTPRPGADTVAGPGQAAGLSAWDSSRPGKKAQGIETDKLKPPLKAIPDDPERGGTKGHFTIAPKPVARTDNLERLAALSGEPALTTGLWGDLHGEIQEQFALLEAEVLRKVPGVQVDTGRTQGERFFLFSYRTFSLPHSTVDPVVAGITFMPVGDDVTVEADVSGEQMGDWIASIPRQTVANSRNALLKAAIDSARELLQSADLIVIALTNTSRNVA